MSAINRGPVSFGEQKFHLGDKTINKKEMAKATAKLAELGDAEAKAIMEKFGSVDELYKAIRNAGISGDEDGLKVANEVANLFSKAPIDLFKPKFLSKNAWKLNTEALKGYHTSRLQSNELRSSLSVYQGEINEFGRKLKNCQTQAQSLQNRLESLKNQGLGESKYNEFSKKIDVFNGNLKKFETSVINLSDQWREGNGGLTEGNLEQLQSQLGHIKAAYDEAYKMQDSVANEYFNLTNEMSNLEKAESHHAQEGDVALKSEIEALKADIKTSTATQETTTQINEDIAKYRSALTKKYNACNNAIENERNSSEDENTGDPGTINFLDTKSASVKSMYETAMSQLNELAEKTKSMSESLSSGTVDAEQLSKLRETAKEEGERQRKWLENLDNSLQMLTNTDMDQTIGHKGGVSKIPG